MTVKLSAVFVLLVICQICSSAPAAANDDSPSKPLPECIKIIVEQFGNNPSESEKRHILLNLISLAVQDENETVYLNHLIGPNFNVTDEHGFLENELKAIEAKLTEALKPAQTEHVMKIINGLNTGVTRETYEATLKDIALSAASKCPSASNSTTEDSLSEASEIIKNALLEQGILAVRAFVEAAKSDNATEEEGILLWVDLLTVVVHSGNKTTELEQVLKPRFVAKLGLENGKDSFSEEELKEIENEVTKILNPEQTERVMKFVRSLREGVTEAETVAAADELYADALYEVVVSAMGILVDSISDELVLVLSEAAKEKVRERVAGIKGLTEKNVSDLKNILKNLGENATDDESIGALIDLITLASQGDNENKQAVDLRQVLEPILNNKEDSIFTENELKELETELAKLLKPAQVERALSVFQLFREGVTQEEIENTFTESIISTLESLAKGVTITKATK